MVLPPDELADFWRLEVPLEAEHVPDDELRRAVAQGRVQEASSWSSMGTAETYWRRVGSDEPLERLRADCVVLPPGEQVKDVPLLERYDDRDVVGCLWEPFHEDRLDALARRMGEVGRKAFAAERARVAAAHGGRRHRRDWHEPEAKALRLELVRLGVRLARGAGE